MTAAQLLARIQETKANVSALHALWSETISDDPDLQPSRNQFQVWLKLYDFDLVVDAIESLVIWLNKAAEVMETPPALSALIKYASGIMANKKNPKRAKAHDSVIDNSEVKYLEGEVAPETDAAEVDTFNIEDDDD